MIKRILMIKDGKAESLGSQRVVSTRRCRWSEVMHLCADDKEREQAKRRCDECLEKAKRPPAKQVVFCRSARSSKRDPEAHGAGQDRRGGVQSL
ncbi:PerC family transcriptional regulator [Klebsiella variicola]|nr:PerC family transcriptional regulator [Klebsiella variicola]